MRSNVLKFNNLSLSLIFSLSFGKSKMLFEKNTFPFNTLVLSMLVQIYQN